MNQLVYKIELARGRAIRRKAPGVRICRGEKRGCPGEEQPKNCLDCYHVDAADPRSSTQILADMERGDA